MTDAQDDYRKVIDEWLITDSQEGTTDNAENDFTRMMNAHYQQALDPQVCEDAARLRDTYAPALMDALMQLDLEVRMQVLQRWQKNHVPFPMMTPGEYEDCCRTILYAVGADNATNADRLDRLTIEHGNLRQLFYNMRAGRAAEQPQTTEGTNGG